MGVAAVTMGFITTGALLALLCLSPWTVKGQSLWRDDGRCGEEFPLADGSPGQCDPAGDGPRQGPCCSPKGFCGNTEKHCKCGTCVDYSKITETLKPEPDTRETSKLVQTKARETVQTRSGDIEGSRVVSEEGVTHYKFHGIPYAQPPVDKLRFKPPRLVRPWTTVLDASVKGPYCMQVQDPALGPAKEMSEDCLHLSIYTSNVTKPYQPVMVWIHGGGFTQGSANDYTPTALIREGVIVVAINYMLLMPMLDTPMLPMVTTMASVKLRLTLLSSMLAMLATPTLLPMELSPTPSLPPPPVSSTLPTLVCAPTTLELLFLARQYKQHHSTDAAKNI